MFGKNLMLIISNHVAATRKIIYLPFNKQTIRKYQNDEFENKDNEVKVKVKHQFIIISIKIQFLLLTITSI